MLFAVETVGCDDRPPLGARWRGAAAPPLLRWRCPRRAAARGRRRPAIGHVEPDRRRRPGRSVSACPRASTSTSTASRVTVDGKDARRHGRAAGSTPASVKRTTVLAIDTSNSHGRASRIAAAKAAADDLPRRRPRRRLGRHRRPSPATVDDAAGAHPRPRRPPDADRRAHAGHGRPACTTASLAAADDWPAPTGQRTLLVLSDGADTSTTTELADGHRRDRATASCSSTSSRSTRPPSARPPLAGIADAGGGQVISADPTALERGLHRRGRRPGPPAAGHRRRARRRHRHEGDRRRSAVRTATDTLTDSARSSPSAAEGAERARPPTARRRPSAGRRLSRTGRCRRRRRCSASA